MSADIYYHNNDWCKFKTVNKNVSKAIKHFDIN